MTRLILEALWMIVEALRLTNLAPMLVLGESVYVLVSGAVFGQIWNLIEVALLPGFLTGLACIVFGLIVTDWEKTS